MRISHTTEGICVKSTYTHIYIAQGLPKPNVLERDDPTQDLDETTGYIDSFGIYVSAGYVATRESCV